MAVVETESVMGWQPGSGAGADPDSGVPGGGYPGRDPRLAWFASADGRDALVPSGLLALAADEVSGPGRRGPGATWDELTGLLRTFAAIESWAASAKLGVAAEMIRRDDAPRPGGGCHGDLPDTWSPSLRHELALALACPVQSAETTLWLAWELQARLPGIGALLEDGTLTLPKARAVIETFRDLTDADAATAESLILGQLAGKTYTQVLRLAERAALTVDPAVAERRRKEAQQRDARVTLFRELSGAAGLVGHNLPPDEALAAMANVNARAQQYEDSGAFGDTPMDLLRVYAYLDLLKGTPAGDRIARAEAYDEAADSAEALAWASARAARNAAQAEGPGAADGACRRDNRDDDDDGDDESGDGGDDNGGPGPGRPDSGRPGSGPGAPPEGRVFQPRPPDLIVPLLTLLGLAERPGEVQGFGLLDPNLARDMAAAAAASPRTEICVTVTSPSGYAIGHGCARPERSKRSLLPATSQAATSTGAGPAGLPARLNLTIPVTALASLCGINTTADGRGSVKFWAFSQRASTGPPGGADPSDDYGTWALVLPHGQRLNVRLDMVPTFGCDHRYETHGYHPSAKLRHLVQVRDGTCTFPSCNRHAKDSDFEHAVPYDRGGRTCACNAGARSRACHQVKQSKNWKVTQPRPGWHEWTAPSGRVYVQEPKRYLA